MSQLLGKIGLGGSTFDLANVWSDFSRHSGSKVLLELLWMLPSTRLLLSFLHLVNHESLIVEVLELVMDVAELILGKAEGLAVGKVLEGSELIQEDQVLITDVEVDPIKILAEEDLWHRIRASLLESHVHDSTEHLEEVLYKVFSFVVPVEADSELGSLGSDHLAGGSAMIGLQVLIRTDELQPH